MAKGQEVPATKPVAMIGLGTMGSAMSKNLIAAGFDVTGHDVAGAAMAAFTGAGGIAAASAAEAAGQAEIIITSLPSSARWTAWCGGLPRCPPLPDPRRDQHLRARGQDPAQRALEAQGISMLDCPLSGSGSQALERDVLVYASGPKAPMSTACRCCAASRGAHYLGEFGNGSKMKYIANLLVAIHTAAAGEAFTLARKAGLDPAQMFEVVADGAGGSRAMQVRGPMLIADAYLPIRTMPLELWRKDMRVIADFANSLACPTPLFAACAPLFNAAIASGYGELDTAAVCKVIETMAGIGEEDGG